MTGCATSVDAVSLQIAASGGGTLSYSATGLSSGLSLNGATGLITGTISTTAAAIGSFPATVTVSDGTHSASVGFAWSVAAAGTITMTNPGSQSSAEGAAVSLNIGAGYTGSGTLRYFAQGLPAGLAINPATGRQFSVILLFQGNAARNPTASRQNHRRRRLQPRRPSARLPAHKGFLHRLVEPTARESAMKCLCLAALFALALAPAGVARADDPPDFSRKEVIYGRKYGTALTMDVFTPKKDANGAAVIVAVSGGWFSSHEAVNPGMAQPFLKRGYTVFAVVHGSQPKFSIPEILEDMNRAVRFIRFHAKDYGIDPDRIGITGGSAGGHLSLMKGTAGDAGNPQAKDPVDRTPSRVQAVACYFPPTDFLNWGEKGKVMLGDNIPVPVKGAFDFRQRDLKSGALVPITDEEKRLEIGKKISPLYHVTKDDPPTLIVHGDKDALVPIQQAEVMVAKLKGAGVPAELVVVKGGGHDGKVVAEGLPKVVAWFDKYLAKKK